MKSSLEYVRDDFVQLLRKEQLPIPEFNHQILFLGKKHWRLDAAWPSVRVAVLFDQPPYMGESIACQTCGRLQKEWNDGKVRLIRRPNPDYSPDLDLYNRAVANGWRVLRVDRVMLHNDTEGLARVLSFLLLGEKHPFVAQGGQYPIHRGAVAGWMLARQPFVTTNDIMAATGLSERGARKLMYRMEGLLPIEHTLGQWRIKWPELG